MLFRSRGATSPPPPHPTLSYHQRMKAIFSLRYYYHPHSHCSRFTCQGRTLIQRQLQLWLITSGSSPPPRWGSPCVCGRRPRPGSRRDSRVCPSSDGWHRTGCHSDSRSLWGRGGGIPRQEIRCLTQCSCELFLPRTSSLRLKHCPCPPPPPPTPLPPSVPPQTPTFHIVHRAFKQKHHSHMKKLRSSLDIVSQCMTCTSLT